MTTKRTKGEKDSEPIYTEEEHRLVKKLAGILVEGFIAIYEEEWKKEDEAGKEADMQNAQITLPPF